MLARFGFRVVIKDISMELAPVILVFAQCAPLGVTRVATGAAFEVPHALDAALMELESGLYATLANRREAAIRPHHVQSPDDHARL